MEITSFDKVYAWLEIGVPTLIAVAPNSTSDICFFWLICLYSDATICKFNWSQ